MRGYTLTEVLVTLTIFSLLTVAVGGVFDSSQQSLDWNQNALTLQKELRRTLSTMSQEIRESSPSSPTPLTVASNSISFEIPAVISGNVVTAWTRIDYALGPDNRVRRTANGQTTVIGAEVQSLNFIYPVDPVTAPRTVQIQITGTRTGLRRTVTRTVTGQVVLRNP